ncbi:MAG: divergent PAP2 family protein [Spirochaetaceae bacterium]|nr:MAG: divergent PAP2 family protein [Spirochaetaceae bacterium]
MSFDLSLTISQQLQLLFKNPVFLSTFMSWLMAQVIKSIIDSIRNRSSASKDIMVVLLWKTGGMPSSHSSMVVCLALSSGLSYGFHSPAFLVAFFFGGLVIRDAMGVRLSAGRQARVLNRLGKELEERCNIPFIPVKEVNGHTPAEVSVGALLGCFMALAFHFL